MIDKKRVSQYSNPPILEGIIDIQVEIPLENQLIEKLQQVGKTASYSEIEKLFSTEFKIDTLTKETSGGTPKEFGINFKAEDETRVLRLKLDGFTFAKLAPYKHWEDLQGEAKRIWEIYRSVLKPIKVKRLAVRYINRIDIPKMDKPEQYLLGDIKIPTDLPQKCVNYVMQVILPLEEIKGKVIVTQTEIEPVSLDAISIILDIDTFVERDFTLDSQEIWDVLEILRLEKNKVFEAYITDKTRELIK